MKILAIDTSSKTCSVAIVKDSKTLIELHSDDERTHSVKLMPMIDKAFKHTNLTLDDIHLLACAVGPGSFTGIRIGIATIKAFADVKNIPIVAINSIESLAYNLIRADSIHLQNTLICSLLDARNHNVYAGFYTEHHQSLKPETPLLAENISTVLQTCKNIVEESTEIQKVIFIGDGANLYQEMIQQFMPEMHTIFLDNAYNQMSSISIAELGYMKYQNGEYGDSSSLSPVYLRKSQAERALEEKEKHTNNP